MRFAHNSERQFAKLLDFYNIAWDYEPRTFTLEWDRDGRPAQAFTPDFYLPAYDIYIEITTLNQKLVTKKNRKARRLREQYPDVEIRVLYQRDYLHLLVKYGLEPPSQLAAIDASGAASPLRLDLPAAPACRAIGCVRHLRGERVRFSPLDAQHRKLGARMVPFGGWEMPLQYTGVLDEHRACREGAVVFDVSHLGTVEVRGPGAFDALQWLLTNDLNRIEPGRAQYTHLLDPVDAHVVDDIIVWWVAADRFLVMPNASNTDRLASAAAEAIGRGSGAVEIADVTASRAVLAVQGPTARAVLAAVSPEAAAVPRFSVEAVGEWVVAGTGYTGEDGVELQVPAERAPDVWDAIVAAGVIPAGLGARDTLRLEAGLPLHGHELGPGITPLQAGLGWVVRWDKGDFRGREPLEAERERGVARRLRGIAIDGRRPARDGARVLLDGADVGLVTSGNFSPTLGHAIALALLAPEIEIGAAVQLDVRGQLLDGVVVKPPFVAR